MKSNNLAFISFALALVPTLSVGARADGEPAWGPFSANIALTSDYRFRGQSQGQGEPALSGGIDYAGSSGFFAGVWASNVDFNDAAETYLEACRMRGQKLGNVKPSILQKTTGWRNWFVMKEALTL